MHYLNRFISLSMIGLLLAFSTLNLHAEAQNAPQSQVQPQTCSNSGCGFASKVFTFGEAASYFGLITGLIGVTTALCTIKTVVAGGVNTGLSMPMGADVHLTYATVGLWLAIAGKVAATIAHQFI